jgi:hypothetical protein
MARYAGFVVAFLGASAATVLLADQPVNLNVDLGLWEVNTKPTLSGDMQAMMDQQLQQVPPERREQMRSMMQAMMAGALQPRVFKKCVTHATLAKGFAESQGRSGCKQTLASNSASDLEVREQCTNGGEENGYVEHIHAVSRHEVSGAVDGSQRVQGHEMKVHTAIVGKWIGSDCGSVKDFELEH